MQIYSDYNHWTMTTFIIEMCKKQRYNNVEIVAALRSYIRKYSIHTSTIGSSVVRHQRTRSSLMP